MLEHYSGRVANVGGRQSRVATEAVGRRMEDARVMAAPARTKPSEAAERAMVRDNRPRTTQVQRANAPAGDAVARDAAAAVKGRKATQRKLKFAAIGGGGALAAGGTGAAVVAHNKKDKRVQVAG